MSGDTAGFYEMNMVMLLGIANILVAFVSVLEDSMQTYFAMIGLRMVIHQPERMPFPEDEGISIAPGHSTSVGMREVI